MAGTPCDNGTTKESVKLRFDCILGVCNFTESQNILVTFVKLVNYAKIPFSGALHERRQGETRKGDRERRGKERNRVS